MPEQKHTWKGDSDLSPEEPDMRRSVSLEILDKASPHHVVDIETGESLMPWAFEREDLVALLEQIPPQKEIIVRLRLGIDTPPMDGERIREALKSRREEERSIEKIIKQTIKKRSAESTGPYHGKAGREYENGLTWEEIARIIKIDSMGVSRHFTNACRLLASLHEQQNS